MTAFRFSEKYNIKAEKIRLVETHKEHDLPIIFKYLRIQPPGLSLLHCSKTIFSAEICIIQKPIS
jgi:hypothetical protein